MMYNMTQPHYRHRWVQKEVAGEQLESVWAIFGESRGHHLVALRSRHELLEQLSWLIKQSGLNYTLILPLRLTLQTTAPTDRRLSEVFIPANEGGFIRSWSHNPLW